MDPKTLRSLAYEMLRIRMVEEKIVELYPEQEMRCPVHLCIGQEAVPVGVCAHLSQDDHVLGGHRSHGHYLAKGGNLQQMMAELYGKKTGCCQGKGGSMHLVDLDAGFLGSTPIVASTIPIAVGAAFGSVMGGKSRITVVFFGEGATEEGVFHESLNFAGLKQLPVVFVCENNLYSVYSPLSVRRPDGSKIFQLAREYDVDGHQGDGNDVLQVFDLAQRAVQRAREGKGPTLLEFATYRWREHCGPHYDNDLGYRTETEAAAWSRRCPIESIHERLVEQNVLSKEDIATMTRELADEIEQAVQFAKTSAFPDESMLMEHVYAP